MSDKSNTPGDDEAVRREILARELERQRLTGGPEFLRSDERLNDFYYAVVSAMSAYADHMRSRAVTEAEVEAALVAMITNKSGILKEEMRAALEATRKVEG